MRFLFMDKQNDRIGFCCILSEKSKEYKVNNTFNGINSFKSDKGLIKTSEKVLYNLTSTYNILDYCKNNNLKLYRMTSELFPFMEFYNLEDLPSWSRIKTLLLKIGNKAKRYDIRLSFHPDKLSMSNMVDDKKVSVSVDRINKHALIMDSMDLEMTTFYHINIHIFSYKEKQKAMDKFIENFALLSESSKKRLTLENDDYATGFTVKDLSYISNIVNIPIVFDSHHHNCHNINIDGSELKVDDAIMLAKKSWGCIKPIAHHSSSKKLYEDTTARDKAHADYIYTKFPSNGFDLEIEAKAKEVAVFKYKKEYNIE